MRPVSLAVLTAIACLSAAPAFAHALLRRSVPPVGATVQTPPAAVTITFTEAVEPRFSSITVQDAAGNRVDAGDTHADPADAKQLSVSLTPLPPGTYTITWHVTSVDTHRTEGSFTVTVAPRGTP
ncbi:copper resistance CopC family protein [Limobrevibacterium gyesilva]|uniref:Copper resistance protein CopC n=1 Tax=Limobrevibacterium gyesilva TaxID=2991712 RepID=A0AA41YN76_9PROT|nr:copper resistance protein CopC [Limobrevibacterium gyesilva]MCW3475815.1 copper resistance protein CopC [Limobrevibacterium gyesilva]